jgi:Flp pilus assembly protein TadB
MAAQQPASAGAERESRSLPELLSEMTGEISTLFRKEIELAKIEIKEDAQRTAKAGGLLGAAGFAGYMTAVLLSLAAGFLLALALPLWVAFLIVAALWGIVGFFLFRRGRDRLKAVHPVPEQTVETVKEDIEWVKARRK